MIAPPRIMTNVAVRIVPRTSHEGHPFTELLHSWTECGVERHAVSRVRYAIPDTAHSRAAQVQAFIKRQQRAH